MRVERFFHIRPNGTPLGGATVRVVGDTEQDMVEVQSALCSDMDAYNRKTGRQIASEKPAVKVHLSDLPLVLKRRSKLVVRRVLKVSPSKRPEHPLWDVDYSFATRSFRERRPAI